MSPTFRLRKVRNGVPWIFIVKINVPLRCHSLCLRVGYMEQRDGAGNRSHWHVTDTRTLARTRSPQARLRKHLGNGLTNAFSCVCPSTTNLNPHEHRKREKDFPNELLQLDQLTAFRATQERSLRDVKTKCTCHKH